MTYKGMCIFYVSYIPPECPCLNQDSIYPLLTLYTVANVLIIRVHYKNCCIYNSTISMVTDRCYNIII